MSSPAAPAAASCKKRPCSAALPQAGAEHTAASWTPCPSVSAAAAFAATQGTTQTNCRVQLKELCDRFRVALAFSDATPAPGGGFTCDVSVGNTRVGRGVGPRKVLAKENAAENALRALADGSR